MLINTHMLFARKLYENIDYDKKYLMKDNQFLWGNVKPDCASKYKLKKHYKDESFIMIMNKIEFLCNLSIKDLFTIYTINKFNQELGVICHFLCDYFCLAHNKRWEFKSANVVKDHIKYEKNLDKVAKDFKFTAAKNTNVKPNNVVHFINDMLKQYDNEQDYYIDIKYANYVCNTVINVVLESVIENEYKIRIAESL